jgi:hypothetical protein
VSRENRLQLIRHIQESRDSHVLVYVTGDRHGAQSAIGEDAIRPLYEHLLALAENASPKGRLDLFLYSRGGNVSVPWRIVTMIREFYDEFCVLIPYKAYSATTMISLGADNIVMGKKAELGPIDPTLVKSAIGEAALPPSEISVEDVISYLSFMREKAHLSDQTAIAQIVSQLAEHLTPLTLGSVNRQYSHIRLVARKLLASHREKIEESRINTIIDTLTEKMYSHGHAIGRREAAELGLPIEKPDNNLERLIWELYREYEELLSLNEPIDPEAFLEQQNQEQVKQRIPLSVIESTERLDLLQATLLFQRKRQIPSNPQININLNLSLPPGYDPNQLTPAAQNQLQQILAQVTQLVSLQVQQEIVRQSPIVGIEVRGYNASWENQQENMV